MEPIWLITSSCERCVGVRRLYLLESVGNIGWSWREQMKC
jgi:hypothetical protein